jgi:hypothetical protein
VSFCDLDGAGPWVQSRKSADDAADPIVPLPLLEPGSTRMGPQKHAAGVPRDRLNQFERVLHVIDNTRSNGRIQSVMAFLHGACVERSKPSQDSPFRLRDITTHYNTFWLYLNVTDVMEYFLTFSWGDVGGVRRMG